MALGNLIALGKSRLSGTSTVSTPANELDISSNVKTSIGGTGDASGAGSGAGIAVIVSTTSSQAPCSFTSMERRSPRAKYWRCSTMPIATGASAP